METDLALPKNRIKAWWLSIPYTWRLAFVLWLGMRLLLWGLGAGLFAASLLPTTDSHYYTIQPLNTGISGALLGPWMRWDAVYYDAIIAQGYHSLPQLSAFFPLYPLLAKPITWLGVHPILALTIISNLAFLFALGMFLQEVERLLGEDALVPAGLAMLLFPTSFYFYAPYPHSLALLLIFIAWNLARKEKWLGCAIVGLLLGLTHSSVIPLVVILFFYATRSLKQSTSRMAWVKLTAPLMPLAGVALFLAWRISQGFPPFGSLQYQFWQTEFLGPFEVVRQFIYQIFHGRTLAIFALILFVVSILALVWLLRKRMFLEAIYLAVLILFLVSFTMPNVPLGSFNRLIIIGFPMFIAIGAWMKKSRWAYRLILGVSSVLYFIMCFAYLSWLWVA